MTPTRREFIQSLGIALGSFVLTGCGSTPAPVVIVETSCYVLEDPPSPPTPIPSRSHGRQKVRDCWLRLDWLAERTQLGAEEARLAQQALVNQHRAAVDELVAVGELSEDVARYVRVAFVAAAGYALELQSQQASITASEVTGSVQVEPPDIPPTTPGPPTEREMEEAAHETALLYALDSGRRLVQQAELLEEMAATSDIDPETVTVVQAAIQKDMIVLSATDRDALVAFLVTASEGGYHFPEVEDLEMDIPPEVAEAARFLVELILEE